MMWMKKMKTVCQHVHSTASHLVISCPQQQHIKRQHPACACTTHDNKSQPPLLQPPYGLGIPSLSISSFTCLTTQFRAQGCMAGEYEKKILSLMQRTPPTPKPQKELQGTEAESSTSRADKFSATLLPHTCKAP